MIQRTWPLTGELLHIKEEIHQYALDYGLDFYPVTFEICDTETINILAAQGGFPHRYPHWRFGMEYDQLSKSQTYGLSKIYEMVINTNPCYAYLLKSNHLVDQKIVMAHVYGHADFFKNNAWFKNTDKDMMDVMANHKTKIRRYSELHGQDKVEAFIDQVLSLENLLDINILFETPEVRRSRAEKNHLYKKEKFIREQGEDARAEHLKSFMRSKLSSKDSPQVPLSDDEEEQIPKEKASPLDVMMYLMENAPLKEWEADILGCLREEAYYFLPQGLTKIMNEGWASYWHSKIMAHKALGPGEIIDFSDKHASIMAMDPHQINPYKIGIELFRDIEEHWDKGPLGKEGREKIFQIRQTHNDVTFIDEFFTQEFCERHKLFSYKLDSTSGERVLEGRHFETIKKKLLLSLTNLGAPVIEVASGNFANRGELHLLHKHRGQDLDTNKACDTLKNIHALWKRPVHLDTIQNGLNARLSFDGHKLHSTL